ncbi:uncharacterized protein LOC141562174 [Sminthopsis crassicaudata]|uniref:uncharacterized protein LOC141562174 n=1 Tax=Sminthopsis crassicaudata TaxID=9301 RepID=UPI003D6959AA
MQNLNHVGSVTRVSLGAAPSLSQSVGKVHGLVSTSQLLVSKKGSIWGTVPRCPSLSSELARTRTDSCSSRGCPALVRGGGRRSARKLLGTVGAATFVVWDLVRGPLVWLAAALRFWRRGHPHLGQLRASGTCPASWGSGDWEAELSRSAREKVHSQTRRNRSGRKGHFPSWAWQQGRRQVAGLSAQQPERDMLQAIAEERKKLNLKKELGPRSLEQVAPKAPSTKQ